MDVIALVVIVVYLVTVTGIGVALSRRATTASGWAVGGGSMGILMIAFGAAGTRIGGGGTYGVAGNVMTGGVWNLWWYGISSFLAMALVGFFFAVPFRRLKLKTVGEIFTQRYSYRRNQTLTSLCVQTEYFLVNVIEAYVIGVMLVGLTGMPMLVAVAIAAFVLISYTSLGGLWGAAVTNLIHCCVILVGLLTVAVMGINQQGGWEAVTEAVNLHLQDSGKDEAAWWSFTGLGLMPVFAMIFSVVIHTPAASIYTNFSSSARNEKLLKPAFLLAGVIATLMPILAGLIGILTLAEYGYADVGSGYEKLTRLATDINPYVGGLALAAVLAAVISSGGPILLSSSTMFVRDWMPASKHLSDTENLRLYRITTVVYGILAAIVAWIIREYTTVSILDLLLFGFAMVVPPAIAVTYLIYWRGTTEQGAFWGMAVGYVGGLVWFALIKWALAVDFQAPEGASAMRQLFHTCFVFDGKGIDPSYATTIIPLIAVPIVSMFSRKTDVPNEEFYQVVAGQKELAEES